MGFSVSVPGSLLSVSISEFADAVLSEEDGKVAVKGCIVQDGTLKHATPIRLQENPIRSLNHITIPVVAQPFEHLIIDCVGVLPPPTSGCKYMLTVMCQSTRYPAAHPLV